MKTYIVVNSDKLSVDLIKSKIKSVLPNKVIRKGDCTSIRKSHFYDFNSCEYWFESENDTIEAVVFKIKQFIKENASGFAELYDMDSDLWVSLRFVIELDGICTPDTFFDSDLLALLGQIKCSIDIDMYYK